MHGCQHTEAEAGTAVRHTGGGAGGAHGGGGAALAQEKQQPSLVTDASFGFINGCVGIPIMISFASIVFKVRSRSSALCGLISLGVVGHVVM